MSEREQFEAWMSDGGTWPKAVERDGNGQYALAMAAAAWQVWQARAALAASPVPAGWSIERGKGWATVRNTDSRCGRTFYRDDPLVLEFLSALAATPTGLTESAASVSAPAQQAERECRHCGWLCRPNPAESQRWYPLTDPAPAPSVEAQADDDADDDTWAGDNLMGG